MRVKQYLLTGIIAVAAMFLPLSGISVAEPSVPGGGTSATAVAPPMDFTCNITESGGVPCGAPFDMPAGSIIKVNLQSSGNSNVAFSVRDTGNNATMGETEYLTPGSPETPIWQNNTGRTVHVQPYATTDNWFVTPKAQGNLVL